MKAFWWLQKQEKDFKSMTTAKRKSTCANTILVTMKSDWFDCRLAELGEVRVRLRAGGQLHRLQEGHAHDELQIQGIFSIMINTFEITWKSVYNIYHSSCRERQWATWSRRSCLPWWWRSAATARSSYHMIRWPVIPITNYSNLRLQWHISDSFKLLQNLN